MRLQPALALIAVLAMTSAAIADEKVDKCEAAPTHACVLDLLWDAMPRVTPSFEGESKRAFIDAALLTKDKALIDLYKERTGYRYADSLNAPIIQIARAQGDKAVLVEHGDRAIQGVRYDSYRLYDIAAGLAAVGETARARKVADKIPHGPDDGVTDMNMHRDLQALIAFHDRTPVTLKIWADKAAADNGWWDDGDLDWLKTAGKRAGNAAAFGQELQTRYSADGWRYLRGLLRFAPEMTAKGDAAVVAQFRGYVETWADPRQENIADMVLKIAARAHPDVRAAMLAAFDARQPAPPPRISMMRAQFASFDAPLDRKAKAAFGLAGGSLAQSQAAIALATLTQEEFLAQAKAGTGYFSLGRPATLKAALEALKDDEAFAEKIAQLMADMSEERTSDNYDLASYATEWAVDHCRKDLFRLASSRLARPDDMEVYMWEARFNGDPVMIAKYFAMDTDRVQSNLESALRGYEKIIVHGYCKAGQ